MSKNSPIPSEDATERIKKAVKALRSATKVDKGQLSSIEQGVEELNAEIGRLRRKCEDTPGSVVTEVGVVTAAPSSPPIFRVERGGTLWARLCRGWPFRRLMRAEVVVPKGDLGPKEEAIRSDDGIALVLDYLARIHSRLVLSALPMDNNRVVEEAKNARSIVLSFHERTASLNRLAPCWRLHNRLGELLPVLEKVVETKRLEDPSEFRRLSGPLQAAIIETKSQAFGVSPEELWLARNLFRLDELSNILTVLAEAKPQAAGELATAASDLKTMLALEGKLRVAEERIEEADAKISELQARAAKLDAELHEAKGRFAVAQEQCDELACLKNKLEAELGERTRELTRARDELEVARKALNPAVAFECLPPTADSQMIKGALQALSTRLSEVGLDHANRTDQLFVEMLEGEVRGFLEAVEHPLDLSRNADVQQLLSIGDRVYRERRELTLRDVDESSCKAMRDALSACDSARGAVIQWFRHTYGLEEIQVIPNLSRYDPLYHDEPPGASAYPADPRLGNVIFGRVRPGFVRSGQVLMKARVRRFMPSPDSSEDSKDGANATLVVPVDEANAQKVDAGSSARDAVVLGNGQTIDAEAIPGRCDSSLKSDAGDVPAAATKDYLFPRKRPATSADDSSSARE